MSVEPCIRRHTRFASDAIGSGGPQTYTVPLGETWSITCISGLMFPIPPSQCHIEFWIGGDAFLGTFTAGGADPNPFTYVDIEFIINETEVLSVVFVGGVSDAAQYYIGGFKTVPGSNYSSA